MKSKVVMLFILSLAMISCNNDDDNNTNSNVNLTFNFTHNWDGTTVTSADFNSIQYTNAMGTELSISKLRYLISDIRLTNLATDETISLNYYQLVDLTDNNTMTVAIPEQIPTGVYAVSFSFGFKDEDNFNHDYADLNTANWNVPEPMGGGYHYMQFEGKYINSENIETGYAYHAIRAIDMESGNTTDTHIVTNLGNIEITDDATIEVKMNIAQWFKDPNTWDLNTLYQMLMPNYNAQLMMKANGQNAFSLGEVTQ